MNNIYSICIHRLFLSGIFCLILLPAGWAQNSVDSLKIRLEESHGKDKLLVLNDLVVFYLSEQDARQAQRYARDAETLAENIISPDNRLISETDYYLKPLTFLHLGQVLQQLGEYEESKTAYEKALAEAMQINAAKLAEEARQYIQEINSISLDDEKKKKRFLDKTFRDITSSLEKTSDDFGIKANLKLAQMHENNQNYDKAIKKYTTVINQLRDKGDWEQVEELRKHIEELLEKKDDFSVVIGAPVEIMKEGEAWTDIPVPPRIPQGTEVVTQRIHAPALPQMPANLKKQEIAKVEEKLRDIKYIAQQAENTQDFEKSLNFYKQYLAMEQTLAEQEKMQELALLEKAHQIENQEQEITLLKQSEEISHLQLMQNQIELKKQLILKRSLAGGLILLVTLVFSLYLLYRNKRRDHQKLTLAFHGLEIAQNKLSAAEQRIKALLRQQVSGAVANELLTSGGDQKVQQKFVCIMFLDIRDFTPYVETLAPEDIIEYQNNVLGFMIETVHKRNGIVNQILGDGFMATFGAPVSAGNDCMEAYLAAQEIIRTVQEKNERGEIPATRIGIGLHAGHVVAGNVGASDRKQYSITGNPVIIASRLEQLNKEFGSTLVISKEVYDHLPEALKEPMKFNEVKVKGRSESVEVASF